MKAAVMTAPSQDLAIEEVELGEPRQGEVLVRLVATGVCHSDVSAWQGSRIPLPAVLGHEGAGIVEQIGPGVIATKPGDHVLLNVVPRCGRCEPCVTGQPQLCQTSRPALYSGTLLDGTSRLSRSNGDSLWHFFAQSSFAERAVVSEGAVVPIRRDAPLDKLAPLACGASTGIGAVLNAARPEVGSTIAVVGCGGVGLSAIAAAALTHPRLLIAVDIADDKLELARSFGATHTFNGAQEDPVSQVIALTGAGVDHAFECVGHPVSMDQMVQMIRSGGHGYVVGAAPPGVKLDIDAGRLLSNKHLHGVAAGNVRPSVDLPRFVDLYMDGKLPLDRLVTRTYDLNGVNAALRALETGALGRGVIRFE
jgi:S-(hydroxymethyl)glutathione dehydrogenase/alcohol dehydrogenase